MGGRGQGFQPKNPQPGGSNLPVPVPSQPATQQPAPAPAQPAPAVAPQQKSIANMTVDEYLGTQNQAFSQANAVASANTNFMKSRQSGDKKYTSNCQRCAWTYEMRRRGYDVVARPYEGKNDEMPYASARHPGSYLNVVKGGLQRKQFGEMWSWMGKPAKVKDVEDYIKGFGDGTRGFLSMNRSGTGHVINWEVEGGKIKLFDAQSGKTDYTVGKLKKDYKMRIFTVARTDNIPLSDITDLIKKAVRPASQNDY